MIQSTEENSCCPFLSLEAVFLFFLLKQWVRVEQVWDQSIIWPPPIVTSQSSQSWKGIDQSIMYYKLKINQSIILPPYIYCHQSIQPILYYYLKINQSIIIRSPPIATRCPNQSITQSSQSINTQAPIVPSCFSWSCEGCSQLTLVSTCGLSKFYVLSISEDKLNRLRFRFNIFVFVKLNWDDYKYWDGRAVQMSDVCFADCVESFTITAKLSLWNQKALLQSIFVWFV